VGHIVHSSASKARIIDTLFFMLGWPQCSFHKKRARTRYAKLVFLHPVVSMGQVLHSGASEAQNIDALFLLFRWDRYVFYKKHNGTWYLEVVFCI
jgi:hypothetical protein